MEPPPPPPPREHVYGSMLVAQGDPGQVDVDHPLPVREVQPVNRRLLLRDSRVGDQNVQPAESIQRRLHQGRDARLAGYVAAHEDRRIAKLGGQRRRRRVDIADHHPGALGHEQPDNRLADPGTAAGNDGNPPLQHR
ncbi:hypothetical protein SAMN04244579_02651 [Azotobacter beijerinckii]|uniref:Uncharacterized protein n=1 Tax=Azotobacter beijerinckii TaxID=170623 RepID=A0A1H6V7D5_9GAMM|nr:hypothetical protein SAMN04244579_02651 [Azotobacter beijerinckii]